MSASFPNAKKTFSAVVNGVTKLVAALFNTAYDEIEAEQTFIGAMGSTQANTDSIKNLLIGYYSGCDVSYKGAADLYVRAGSISIPDASGNLRLRRNTADLTVDWSMIDTGSEAGSTKYYVYAIADAAGTTFTVKISANATAPSGCTFYRPIGIFYNDASSNITNPVSTLSIPTGSVVQVVNYQTGAVATGTTPMPKDDSIPQNTEGDEYMTLAITPKSVTNKLKIDVVLVGGVNSNGLPTNIALFQDSTVNALAAVEGHNSPNAEDARTTSFTHYMTTGTISATTFKVRAGGTTGVTFTFNGYSAGTRIFGGVCASNITITEIKT